MGAEVRSVENQVVCQRHTWALGRHKLDESKKAQQRRSILLSCRFASYCLQSYTFLVKALLDKMGVTSSSLKSSWTKAVKFAALPYHWVMAS